MTTNKMIARRVSAFGFAAMSLTAMVSAPAKALAPATDGCYALSGGAGWSFYAAANIDINSDGSADNKFMFYSRPLYVEGEINPALTVNDSRAKRTVMFGKSSKAEYPVAVKIQVDGTGDPYRPGTATLWMARDLNNNGLIDAGEPSLLPRTSAVIQLVSSVQNFSK